MFVLFNRENSVGCMHVFRYVSKGGWWFKSGVYVFGMFGCVALVYSFSTYMCGVRFTCMWPITCFIIIRMYENDGAASSLFRVSVSTAAHRLWGQRERDGRKFKYTVTVSEQVYLRALWCFNVFFGSILEVHKASWNSANMTINKFKDINHYVRLR